MVDAIKNTVNRLDLTKARSSETRAAPAGANRTAAPTESKPNFTAWIAPSIPR